MNASAQNSLPARPKGRLAAWRGLLAGLLSGLAAWSTVPGDTPSGPGPVAILDPTPLVALDLQDPAQRRPSRDDTNTAAPAVSAYAPASELHSRPKPEVVTPQPRAHAHNDYEHPRPLLDALACGFCSVEADVHLVEGRLLVAHDRAQIKPGRTLQALYLEPLRERVLAHRGRVHPGGPGFMLLIDFKSDAQTTYAALKDLLKPYWSMLTRFEGGQIHTNAVTIVISGNRPAKAMLADPVRYAAYDGRPGDLQAAWPPAFMPLISDSWRNHFQWRGSGPMPEPERQRLRELVATTHQQGRKLRLWAIPDRAEVWSELLEAGVDLINTDRLQALEAFLKQRQEPK